MVTIYQTGSDFLEANDRYLGTDPHLAAFFRMDAPLLRCADTVNYALRCASGEAALLALKAEPYDLLLFGDPGLVPELLGFLFGSGYEVKNYLCVPEVGAVLQQELLRRGRPYEEALAMNYLECRAVTEPSDPAVVSAGSSDVDEIFDCLVRFIADCGLDDKPDREHVKKLIDRYHVLRENGQIVSMASVGHAPDGTDRITAVYTRDEFRGRGYARRVVNTLKNEILAEGRTAALYVDRRNPVSSHLYASLGFRRVFSQSEYRPVPQP